MNGQITYEHDGQPEETTCYGDIPIVYADCLCMIQRVTGLGTQNMSTGNRDLDGPPVYVILGSNSCGFRGTCDAFMECIHPDDRERVQNTLETSVYQCVNCSIEHRVVGSDGRVLHVNGLFLWQTSRENLSRLLNQSETNQLKGETLCVV